MATVLSFPPPTVLADRRRHEKMLRAKELIFQAAQLLGEMSDGEVRVAWLLEDCVGLLDGEPAHAAELPSRECDSLVR